jgi:hypothetical protein
MMRLRDRQVLRCGMRARWQFADDGAFLEDLFEQLFVLLGITGVDTRSEHSNRSTADGRPRLRKRVHAPGQTANDYQPALGEVATEALRHLRAIDRRTTGAYDAEAGRIQNTDVTSDVEQDRRIVDLQQRPGVFGLCTVQDPAANAPDGFDFLFRAPEALLPVGSLRRKITRFKRRESGSTPATRGKHPAPQSSGTTSMITPLSSPHSRISAGAELGASLKPPSTEPLVPFCRRQRLGLLLSFDEAVETTSPGR